MVEPMKQNAMTVNFIIGFVMFLFFMCVSHRLSEKIWGQKAFGLVIATYVVVFSKFSTVVRVVVLTK